MLAVVSPVQRTDNVYETAHRDLTMSSAGADRADCGLGAYSPRFIAALDAVFEREAAPAPNPSYRP